MLNSPRRPLFQRIKNRSLSLYKKACEYSHVTEDLAKVRQQLHFNLRCKRYNVLPQSLLIRPPIRTPSGWATARAMGHRYLSNIIQDNHYRIHKYNRKIYQLVSELSSSIPDLLDELKIIVNRNFVKKTSETKVGLKTKFDRLMNKQYQNRSYFNEKSVKNISSRTLTSTEQVVLGKGLKFNTQHSKKDLISFVANIDEGLNKIQNISDIERAELQAKVASSVASVKNRNNLTHAEKQALQSLKNDASIKVVPADKGNCTVVIDTDEYYNKVEQHLSDSSTYVLVNDDIYVNAYDPNKTLQNKIIRELQELKRGNLIEESLYKSIYPNTPCNPLFYATIKIHKPNNPIRPIVSFIDTPSYRLSQFISKLLMPTADRAPQKLKNSTNLIKSLKDLTIPVDYSLVSFDVKSLFTSIPLDLAIDSISIAIDNDPDIASRTRLNKDQILQLCQICFNANIFQYNQKLYKQIKGTPMGSPMSVVLAELTMQNILSKMQNQMFNSNQFILWKRYVDDCIAIIKNFRHRKFSSAY